MSTIKKNNDHNVNVFFILKYKKNRRNNFKNHQIMPGLITRNKYMELYSIQIVKE